MKIIYGAGGHGRVVADILKSVLDLDFVFFDDNPDYNPYNLVFLAREYNILESLDMKIVAIGDNKNRRFLANKMKFPFFNAIHKNTSISENTIISTGNVISAGAIIGNGTFIGQHCILNTASTIDHDCFIDDFVHISPNATLCGGVKVGFGSHIGAGAIVIPNINIGKWVTVGAGTIVIRDIPDFAVVVGNPGRIIKYNKSQNEQ